MVKECMHERSANRGGGLGKAERECVETFETFYHTLFTNVI